MIHMVHQNPNNHTGITWRIFRGSLLEESDSWIQPFLSMGAGVNGCCRHQTLACCTGPGHSRPRSATTSGRQILVIRRCESWSSATNIRNPFMCCGPLGPKGSSRFEIVGKGSTKSPGCFSCEASNWAQVQGKKSRSMSSSMSSSILISSCRYLHLQCQRDGEMFHLNHVNIAHLIERSSATAV